VTGDFVGIGTGNCFSDGTGAHSWFDRSPL
jgi:hypothetical protein